MDPSTIETLAGLLSGDPHRVALAVDGLCLVMLPVIVGWVVTRIRRRPPPVTARLEGSARSFAELRRWVFRNRVAIVDSTPLVLAVLVTVARAVFALQFGMDPFEHAARGFGVAAGAVGLHQMQRAPARVRAATLDEGDADAPPSGR